MLRKWIYGNNMVMNKFASTTEEKDKTNIYNQ